jgi:hypothetical protein
MRLLRELLMSASIGPTLAFMIGIGERDVRTQTVG